MYRYKNRTCGLAETGWSNEKLTDHMNRINANEWIKHGLRGNKPKEEEIRAGDGVEKGMINKPCPCGHLRNKKRSSLEVESIKNLKKWKKRISLGKSGEEIMNPYDLFP
ncbi:hypothetical protein NPIL_183351 [Nephila pilipes]|uniref:Uncharacterized protein n=1 Tax=Nephila pilipes TaxID=299642 RepID=A0A8X6TAM4_NEPPI|nr:hypothetical protein NPIL_183351 [Nephila pilipes]